MQALELFGERALAGRQLAQTLHRSLTTHAHHRQQALRVTVHPLLLLRHAGELLERLLEPRARLCAGNLLGRAHERMRGGVQRIERLFREWRRGGRVGLPGGADRARGRRSRISSRPASGASARSRTADATPTSPVTAFAHQCMP